MLRWFAVPQTCCDAAEMPLVSFWLLRDGRWFVSLAVRFSRRLQESDEGELKPVWNHHGVTYIYIKVP